MALNASDLMSILNDYSKTADGKKKIDAKIKSYQNGSDPKVSASGKTYGGGIIMTKKQMVNAAKDLLAMLRVAGAKEGLPDSVMEHIESFDYTLPCVTADGSFVIQIYMTDDPKRESLYQKKYDGVDNIVAVINNGYTASDVVYGKWHGKKAVSLDKRQGVFFMQKAIDSFNEKYGEKYNISVWLNPIYDGAWNWVHPPG